MFTVRIAMLVLAAALAAPASADAQVPEDLGAAMRARDTAFDSVDPSQWEKYTATEYTTVQQDGFSGGLWVLEVWTKETGVWMVLTTQVTNAKP